MSLQCPSCGHPESWVKDSRPGDGYLRRRRSCDQCKEKFTTYEVVVDGRKGGMSRAYYLQAALEEMPAKRRRLIEDMIVEFAGQQPIEGSSGVSEGVSDELP